MNIDHTNPDANTAIGKNYLVAKKVPGATEEQIKKSLIQGYIIGEGYKSEGSDWSGSVGLLMLIGAHRDEVLVKSEKTGETEFTKSEKTVTK